MFRQDQTGFTLLETLLALFITSIVFLLMSSGLFQARFIDRTVTDSGSTDWNVFLNQLENYLETSEYVYHTSRDLVTKEENSDQHVQTFVYRKSGQSLIRTKKSGGGFQPLLLNVSQVSFYNEGEYFGVEVSFTDGRVRRARLYVRSWQEAPAEDEPPPEDSQTNEKEEASGENATEEERAEGNEVPAEESGISGEVPEDSGAEEKSKE